MAIIINAVVSEDVLASLVNESFANMIREWDREQAEIAWERECQWQLETARYLDEVESQMRSAYERGDKQAFTALWSHYSDVYKDANNFRPRWFFDTCEWYHGPLP